MSEPETPSVKTSLVSFLGYTSAHGLGRLASASGTAKIIWSLFLLGTYIGFTVHLKDLLDRYSKKPLLTSYNPQLKYQYPDLYFCPKNPISLSRFVAPLSLQDRDFLRYNSSLSDPDYLFMDASDYDLDASGDSLLAQQTGNLLQFNIFNNSTRLSEDARILSDLLISLQKILLPEFIKPQSNLSACRVTLDGVEYIGDQNFTESYKLVDAYNSLPNPNLTKVKVYHDCLPWLEVADELDANNALNLTNVNVTAVIRENVVNNTDNRCRAFKNFTLSMLLAANKSLGFNHMAGIKYDSGPFCFFRANDSGEVKLKVGGCGIGFCPLPAKYDCIADSPNGTTKEYYTGRVALSQRGHKCLPWIDLFNETKMNEKLQSVTHEDYYTYGSENTYLAPQIFIAPDGNVKDMNNYCRMVDSLTYKLYWDDNYLWDKTVDKNTYSKPYCPVISNTTGSVEYQVCNVPSCSSMISSLTGLLHDYIGKEIILRKFGNDLHLNMITCEIGNTPCSYQDFTTFAHPAVGTCYRFKHDKYTKGKSYSELADLELNLILYSDSTDSSGRLYDNITTFENTVHPIPSIPSFTTSGFNVFAMPHGEFPHATEAISAPTGMHNELKLRYNMDSTYPNPAECIVAESVENIDYAIYSWPSILENPHSTSFSNATTTKGSLKDFSSDWLENEDDLLIFVNALKAKWLKEFETNNSKSLSTDYSVWKFRSTQDDCINKYKLDAFVESCGCLPSFLPIPVNYMPDRSKNRFCFEGTDIDLVKRQDCYKNLTKNLASIAHAGEVSCMKPCFTRSYSVRHINTVWPESYFEGIMKTLNKITQLFGFPNEFEQWKGLTGIYYTYLQGQYIRDDNNGSKQSQQSDFLMKTEAIRSNLAWITVSARSAYGHETKQEEAYPFKNLMADFGGILGLWSGVSVLTVCEVIELIIFIVIAIKAKTVKVASETIFSGTESASSEVSMKDADLADGEKFAMNDVVKNEDPNNP